VLLTQILSAATFSSVIPFLPLFLRELGEDEAGAIAWTGAISAVGAAIQLIAIPVWGALADRVGRKPMVARALLVAGGSFGVLTLAVAPWHVLAIRSVQAVGAAPNAALLALAASILPAAHLSLGMGLMQTAQFLGISIGPLFGGLGAATIGFRGVFVGAAASAFATAAAVMLLVREPSRPTRKGASPGLLASLAFVFKVPSWRVSIVVMLAHQTAYTIGWTLLPLQVSAPSGAEHAGLAAWVISANALGIATGAAALGWLGGRIDPSRVGIVALAGSAVLAVPQLWATDPFLLAGLRLAFGFCVGGVLPSLRAALAGGESAGANLGVVYGVAQSAVAGGSVLGAPLAAAIASQMGVPSVHAATAVLFGLTAIWFARARMQATQGASEGSS
jgi:MFS transporter, DHA1 family, multidrug resistance protein